jgi:hypothetical protein
MQRPWSLLAPLLLAAALSGGDARAADTTLALGDVGVPPESSGVDRATLKTTAEGELRGVDASRLRKRRRVVVSVAVIGASHEPFACTINAVLHDGKTGAMIAIIEGRARAEGDATPELRTRVLRAALRSAVSQIPTALAGN